RLQQWPTGILTGALVLLLCRGMEVDDMTSMRQQFSIRRLADDAATGGDVHLLPTKHFSEHGGLPGTKASLALDIEDPGNIGTTSGLDFLVRIDEHPAKFACRQSTDRSLASPHRPDEHEVTQGRFGGAFR